MRYYFVLSLFITTLCHFCFVLMCNSISPEIHSYLKHLCKPVSLFQKFLHLMTNQIIFCVEFRQICNSFQGKLKNDIERIKKSHKIFIFADKSRNIYDVEQEEYKKLLKENITKNYKKSNLKKLHNINKSAKKITEKLPISDRIEKMEETKSYITIKKRKESFCNKFPCHLINPSKSSVRKISKVILDKINNHIQKETAAYQWKDTSSVIEWFVNI